MSDNDPAGRTLADVEPRLIAALTELIDEYGAEGVRRTVVLMQQEMIRAEPRPVWIAPVGTAPDTEAPEWVQIGTASSVQFDGAPNDMYGDDVDG